MEHHAQISSEAYANDSSVKQTLGLKGLVHLGLGALVDYVYIPDRVVLDTGRCANIVHYFHRDRQQQQQSALETE